MSKPRVIHDFATVLGLLSRGRLLERLDEKLAEAPRRPRPDAG
jgi:hypothetical protein